MTTNKGWTLWMCMVFGGACAADEASDGFATSEPTYYGGIAELIDRRCVSCHRDGDIAPFSLSTYAQVEALGGLIRDSVASGRMPPWQGADGCNDYANDFSVTAQEKAALLSWLDAGLPEGEPMHDTDDGEAHTAGVEAAEDFVGDIVLEMETAYLPSVRPDENRCFVLDWPADESRYVTAFALVPGRRDMVHHALLYLMAPEEAEALRAFEDADPEAGYACFGGPIPGKADAAGAGLLGGWVPGARSTTLPHGAGIAVKPGSKIVMQLHYNTSVVDPTPDRTRLELKTEENVERPAVSFLLANPFWLAPGGMSIPAGEASVEFDLELDITQYIDRFAPGLGVPKGTPLMIHSAAVHMHELGTSGEIRIVRPEGQDQCLVDVPKWDFNWQSQYVLKTGAVLAPGDRLMLRCVFDNSADNQPFVDGKRRTPRDVEWGDGTGDEMCLGGLLVSAL